MAQRPARDVPRRAILLYHSVGSSPLALSQSAFRAQMEWLVKNATIATTESLLQQSDAAPLKLALTFDDGYASVFGEAFPVLNDLGATATVFLNTGCIGERDRRASDPALGHYPQDTFLL
ncbi:MAG: hypothetical protein RJB62_1677, partial [Pseudomonadota bacterium]